VRDARRNPPASLRATALRMLARRDFSRAELAQRLLARGGDRDEVTRTLDELEQRGYLSETRYAQALVAQKAGRFGKRAIAQALARRGIAADTARAALDELPARDELAQAMALWQRRFARPPVDDRERAKQVRFLLSRGYDLSIALRVVPAVDGSRRRPSGASTGE
jgi:regulatory protein